MLKSQINSEAPSLLHTIKSKLDVNLDILSELCRTWPIATMLLELFQTITYQGQFDRALELAIENCRKRANGETDSHLRTKPFKRARMSQVILPENRLVLQVLPRESQKQSTSFQSPVTNTEDAARSEVPNNADTNAVLDELGFSWDNADPSIILRNIREFARTGELGVHSGSLRDAYE